MDVGDRRDRGHGASRASGADAVSAGGPGGRAGVGLLRSLVGEIAAHGVLAVELLLADHADEAASGGRAAEHDADRSHRPKPVSGPADRIRSLGPVEITFTKGKGGRTCSWRALRPPRTTVPGPAMAAGGDVPHDLATYVVEAALGIEHGFWGCVADGATFQSLGRKRTPQGRAVIARHAAALDEAEVRVNDAYFAWRRGEPSPAAAELDAMLVRWRALDEHESLVVSWPPAPLSEGSGTPANRSGAQLKRSRRGSSV